RLAAVVLDGAEPDERTAGLIALLHGARLHRLAFPDVPARQVEARMAAIAEGQWAGVALRDAITATQAAVLAATTAAAVAAAVS
ncbi:GPP34 family phosphoprotein, partial [Kitasatospora sp. NPDC047058]|uniref:GPP34 family phosphoprotein n=1 Tax=Kitasatospora sp. NPDC047058 TaxID=3155620 RepID=UPI0033DFC527